MEAPAAKTRQFPGYLQLNAANQNGQQVEQVISMPSAFTWLMAGF